jgi:hypothetical protein
MIQGDLVNSAAGAETIDLTFLTSKTGLGGLSEKMRITNNGDVGIKKSTPTSTLDVNGSLSVKVINNLQSFGSSAITAVPIGDVYYVTLLPGVQEAYYQIPSAASCPGRMMILRKKIVGPCCKYSFIVSPGSNFIEISNGYDLPYDVLIIGGTRNNVRLDAVQLISDGTSWNWWEIKK